MMLEKHAAPVIVYKYFMGEYSKNLIKKAFTASILTIVSMTTIWVHAAFIEPGEGPASSLQDFAQNIIGSGSADNTFDSSSVDQNNHGSIIERLEFLSQRVASSSIFYVGGDPYYCMRKDVNESGYATTTAINDAQTCGSGMACNTGICE